MMGRKKMESNYSFMAKMYDPIFYLALKPIRIAVMNELLKFKDKIILDLCCGTGNQIKLLSKNGFRNLSCLDISDSMLEIAKRSDSSGEHDRNFKNYIQKEGLSSLIEKNKFKLIKCNRMSSGAVAISMYQKIPLL